MNTADGNRQRLMAPGLETTLNCGDYVNAGVNARIIILYLLLLIIAPIEDIQIRAPADRCRRNE